MCGARASVWCSVMCGSFYSKGLHLAVYRAAKHSLGFTWWQNECGADAFRFWWSHSGISWVCRRFTAPVIYWILNPYMAFSLNLAVVWAFFGIAFPLDWKIDLFQSCGHCSVFQICWSTGTVPLTNQNLSKEIYALNSVVLLEIYLQELEIHQRGCHLHYYLWLRWVRWKLDIHLY